MDLSTLTGVAQLVGSYFTKRKVAGSILCQGACQGCGFGPRSGCMPEATNDVSFPLFLFPFSSL